jgi:hypothetical protein
MVFALRDDGRDDDRLRLRPGEIGGGGGRFAAVLRFAFKGRRAGAGLLTAGAFLGMNVLLRL